MKTIGYALSDIGLKRKNNQDYYSINDKRGLYIVADGMGGHRGGEVASQMSVEVLSEFVQKNENKLTPRELLSKGINAASEAVYKKSQSSSQLSGMGTTIVALYFKNNVFHVAHVGDSRAYLINENHLWQVTEDHSLVNEQKKNQSFGEIAVPAHLKNVITRSVGYEEHVTVDVLRREAQRGDVFFLCTDGISGHIKDHEILSAASTQNHQKSLQRLIATANKRGGEDNMTAIIVTL